MKAGKSSRLLPRSMRRHRAAGRYPATWRAHTTCLARSCGLVLALGTGSAQAVGLGPIELASDLNERLDARIPVHDLNGRQIDSVEVGLAAPRFFRDVGIQYRSDLGQLQFELERNPAGGHLIRVRSPRPIVEPFVSFVLELKLPTGRLIREYTVLLDPSPAVHDSGVSQSNGASPPNSSQAPSGEDGTASTTLEANGAIPVDLPESSPEVTGMASESAGSSNGDRYGPVSPGSSAWQVAAAIQQPGTSIYQRMIALFRANPDAFRNNDLNQLKAGAWLDVPAPGTVAAISHESAVTVYQQHVEPQSHAAVSEDGEAAAEDKGASETKPDSLLAAYAGEAGAYSDVSDPAGASEIESRAAEPRTGADMETALDNPPRQDATAEIVTQIAERIEDSLASNEEQVAELRNDLAAVREELLSLQTRQQSRPRAASVGLNWAAGLIALLLFACGVLGGFWGGRRFTMRRLAGDMTDAPATTHVPGPHQEPFSSHGDGDDPSWAATDPDSVPDRKPVVEMNEHSVSSAADTRESQLRAFEKAADLEQDDGAGITEHFGIAEDTVANVSVDPVPDDASTTRPVTDGHAGQKGPGTMDVPLSGGVDDSHSSKESGDGGRETGDIHFREADSDQASDFYHSLAKLYLASGWPSDAETLLRSTIEQKGDKPIYRVRILEALYQLGHRNQFLQEFEAYQAIADANDPGWTWVRTMGKILWPDNPAFDEDGDEAAREQVGDGFYELEQDDLDTLDVGDEDITFELGNEEPEGEAIEGIEEIRDEEIGNEENRDEAIEDEEILDIFDDEDMEDLESLALDEPEAGTGDFPSLKSLDERSPPDASDESTTGVTDTSADGKEDEETDERWLIGGRASGQSR